MKKRAIKWWVGPGSDDLYSPNALHVEIDDEGWGLYVVAEDDEHCIGITPEEWPPLRDVIDAAMSELQADATFEGGELYVIAEDDEHCMHEVIAARPPTPPLPPIESRPPGIGITPEEWPLLRDVIDAAMSEIQAWESDAD